MSISKIKRQQQLQRILRSFDFLLLFSTVCLSTWENGKETVPKTTNTVQITHGHACLKTD